MVWNAGVPPSVLELELSPRCQQTSLRSFCAEKGVGVLAAPAAHSDVDADVTDVAGDDTALRAVADACGKSAAQVAARWALQHGACYRAATLRGRSRPRRRKRAGAPAAAWP